MRQRIHVEHVMVGSHSNAALQGGSGGTRERADPPPPRLRLTFPGLAVGIGIGVDVGGVVGHFGAGSAASKLGREVRHGREVCRQSLDRRAKVCFPIFPNSGSTAAVIGGAIARRVVVVPKDYSGHAPPLLWEEGAGSPTLIGKKGCG